MTDPSQSIERALLDIANHFGATVDLGALLDVVLERFARLMNAERALFLLLGEDGQRRAMVAHNLEWDGDLGHLPVSTGLIDAVIRKGEVIVVPDALHDEDLGARKSVKDHALRMLVGVPVCGEDGGVTGVLYGDSQDQAAREWKMMAPVLPALGRLVATAVENARLIEALRVRTRLMAEMVHDLRGPLTALSVATSDLLDDGAAPGREQLEDIAALAAYQSRIVENALALWRATVRTSGVERVDVGKLCQEHLGRYRALSSQREHVIEVELAEGDLRAETVADRVLVVLDNLVVNALKYGDPGTPIEVSVQPAPDGGPEAATAGQDDLVSFFRRVEPLEPEEGTAFVRVTVSSEGAPLSPDALERSGDLLQAQRDGDAQFGSTGLGLSIAAQCVAHLGGRIWIESEGRHTRVHFTLPCETVG